MATYTIISSDEFNARYKDSVGTLMFPSDLYDTTDNMDIKKIRENLKKDGVEFKKGSRITHIIVKTIGSKGFKNISNKKFPYSYRMFADKTTDGAYFDGNYWLYDYPVGDVIVVVKDIKPKAPKAQPKPKSKLLIVEESDNEL